ncbi:KCMB4 protein, partial [Polypterus senegalus]|nr:KCMB4 protein [Polypterus senegalus]
MATLLPRRRARPEGLAAGESRYQTALWRISVWGSRQPHEHEQRRFCAAHVLSLYRSLQPQPTALESWSLNSCILVGGPEDVLLKRSHDENVLLHCVLWPLVTLLVGILIVVLTICAKSLAVRAEAFQKRKFS